MGRYSRLCVSGNTIVRGHVQTIFGKINVIMTLRGGGEPVTLTFLFVYCFLFVNYYSKILVQLCSTGHFFCEVDPLPDASVR